MEYDGEMLELTPAGDETGADDVAQQRLDELTEEIVHLDHELTESKAALDDARHRLDLLAQLLAAKEAALAAANDRIAELNAQLAAVAEDAQYWVDRREFDEQLKLVDEYGKAQWQRRHRSKNRQTFAEWLVELVPVA